MSDFLRNFSLLVIMAAIIFFLFPEIVRQFGGIYSGLGILPFFLIMVVLMAVPRKRRRRR